MKKLMTALAVGFVVLFAVQNPGTAADFLRSAFSGVVAFATALASGGGK